MFESNYTRIVDSLTVEAGQNPEIDRHYVERAFWLAPPGIFVGWGDIVLQQSVRSTTAFRPGFYISLIFEGQGESRLLPSGRRWRYAGGGLGLIAARAPFVSKSQTREGVRLRTLGIGVPVDSLVRMGLGEAFDGLFRGDDTTAADMALAAPPRWLTVGAEMMIRPADRLTEVLMTAQACELIVRGLQALARRSEAQPAREKEANRLLAARRRIDEGDAFSLSVPQLAQEAGLSLRSFNSKFREMFAVNAIDYMRARRLDLALEALRHSGMSVTEAAFLAGYSSPANFATAFRRRFGHSPKHFRNIEN